ncbi:hypothetical protein DAPPUDRAFT_315957 [Daphnia pulex]|uniref:Uncharacterized protein n=1 Tax=Daphnia pulex TaxID=6669 RepID=E9GC50_DAPPU|nr:hypothetical protein DAPPUDRAFT_315957 [Daphnia pulex]|eukprot:EFX82932.1 hypothetical protein DAPPUDRAFT_315957 [Daphnia pulex]
MGAIARNAITRFTSQILGAIDFNSKAVSFLILLILTISCWCFNSDRYSNFFSILRFHHLSTQISWRYGFQNIPLTHQEKNNLWNPWDHSQNQDYKKILSLTTDAELVIASMINLPNGIRPGVLIVNFYLAFDAGICICIHHITVGLIQFFQSASKLQQMIS